MRKRKCTALIQLSTARAWATVLTTQANSYTLRCGTVDAAPLTSPAMFPSRWLKTTLQLSSTLNICTYPPHLARCAREHVGPGGQPSLADYTVLPLPAPGDSPTNGAVFPSLKTFPTCSARKSSFSFFLSLWLMGTIQPTFEIANGPFFPAWKLFSFPWFPWAT